VGRVLRSYALEPSRDIARLLHMYCPSSTIKLIENTIRSDLFAMLLRQPPPFHTSRTARQTHQNPLIFFQCVLLYKTKPFSSLFSFIARIIIIPPNSSRRLLPHNSPLFSFPIHERLSAGKCRIQRIGRSGTNRTILAAATIIIVVILETRVFFSALTAVNAIEHRGRHTVVPALLNDFEQSYSMQTNIHT